jgi:hypothetical protein
MPTNRRPISRAVRYRLSFWEKLSLEYGEAHHRPGFGDDAKRRAAWLRHRQWMLARCRDGRRPAAYWDYEAPIPEPDDCSYRQAALWTAGLLTLEERQQLQATWRAAFEEAQARDFCVVVAPGELLKGEAARRAWYQNYGIPRQLLRRWTQAHRRADKTIRKLTALVPEQ